MINHNIKTIEIHTSLQTVLVINHPKLPIVPHAQYVCTIPQIPKEATCKICLIIKWKKKNCGHTLASNRMSGKCEILCNLMASLLFITISNVRERQVYRNPARRWRKKKSTLSHEWCDYMWINLPLFSPTDLPWNPGGRKKAWVVLELR